MPAFDEIKSNVDMILTNTVTMLQNPQSPKLPNILNVGGIHIQDIEPLPKV